MFYFRIKPKIRMYVPALASMTFYENLLIGQETSVRCLH